MRTVQLCGPFNHDQLAPRLSPRGYLLLHARHGAACADPHHPLARTHLREATRECRGLWPFEMLAVVLLPDHMHTLWRLPEGDTDYAKRIGWLKKEVTKRWLAAGGGEQPISDSRQRNRRRGVWQRRYWEHSIRDEDDLARHIDYIHYNPVKHGHVSSPADWPWSSFHRFVREGIYPADWGSEPVALDGMEPTVGE